MKSFKEFLGESKVFEKYSYFRLSKDWYGIKKGLVFMVDEVDQKSKIVKLLEVNNKYTLMIPLKLASELLEDCYEKGKTYKAVKDIFYGDYDDSYEVPEEFKQKFVKNDTIIFKKGTSLTYVGSNMAGDVFFIDKFKDIELDFPDPYDVIR